jgi:hypothetical protein
LDGLVGCILKKIGHTSVWPFLVLNQSTIVKNGSFGPGIAYVDG